MLKAIRSSSCLQQARFTTGESYLQSNSRHGTKLTSPFNGVLRSVLGDKNPKLFQRVFFCSDLSDGSRYGHVSAVEEAESKSPATIVPTAIKKPDDFLTVILSSSDQVVDPAREGDKNVDPARRREAVVAALLSGEDKTFMQIRREEDDRSSKRSSSCAEANQIWCAEVGGGYLTWWRW